MKTHASWLNFHHQTEHIEWIITLGPLNCIACRIVLANDELIVVKQRRNRQEFRYFTIAAIDKKFEKLARPDKVKQSRQRSFEPEEQIITDSLRRIGGTVGGEGRDTMNLDKKRNDLLGRLVKLYEKDDLGLSNSEVMI